MKIKVYQIDCDHDERNLLFMNYDFTLRHGGVDPRDYKCVYEGDIEASSLEGVYTLLNTNHPDGYRGHSLSVSDIVETENGAFHFCDSFGFKKLNVFDVGRVIHEKAENTEESFGYSLE